MDAQRVIGCLTKVPRAGESKTRLIPSVGAEGAAALQEAFLTDTLHHICALRPPCKAALWVAGDIEHPAIVRAVGELPIHRLTQASGGLGDRIEAAFAEGLASAEAMILIGSDSPTLPSDLLRRGLQALEEHESVLGPTPDGGYYLIGFQRGAVPSLKGVKWSTASTYQDTTERMISAGLRYATLPPWYDVDTPDDLRLLQAHLSLDPGSAPQTAIHFDRSTGRY